MRSCQGLTEAFRHRCPRRTRTAPVSFGILGNAFLQVGATDSVRCYPPRAALTGTCCLDRGAGTIAAQVYGGFLAHLTAWCEHERVPYQGVPVGTIKRHATGKGNAGKEAVIAAMTAKGHRPADDNEADALAILHWALAQGGGR